MARNIVLGILAHVDAGKTTLTESVLLKSGAIRKAGRVDHRDTFLDTDVQERERGITIYAKNAMFTWKDIPFTLIDTPGHSDLAGEAERVLSVLDAAVLLVSAPDGVQGHTLTLWRLLESYRVPTFIFINKMDMPGTDKAQVMREIKRRLSPQAAETNTEDFTETAAMVSDEATGAYLESGFLPEEAVQQAFAQRLLFPCVFGSALRHEGIDALLDTVSRCACSRAADGDFSARIYKIARDKNGEKLAFLKVTGGELRVRTPIRRHVSSGDEGIEEKVSSIRFYSGEKYTVADLAPAGSICAVTGLKSALAGDVLGAEEQVKRPVLEPVFTYRALPAEGIDPHTALSAFRTLEEEDPLLRVRWNEALAEIRVQVMGDVSLEILTRVLHDRFGLEIRFDTGSILYKETVAAPVNGYGHYEPLRHYAEVHLRIEPAPRGSGIRVKSEVPVDELALNWQRLIFTHLTEKQHRGVLTGSFLTDVTFVLTAGRAHLKHTEGGDFRQATYRAVRQGLMNAQSVLLEPWYRMKISLPDACAGRAMSDIDRMGGRFDPPESAGGETALTACAPVRKAAGYQRELNAYSRGLGRMSLEVSGYEPCPDQDAIVSSIGYDPERDPDEPADSVFCSHGAGTLASWREAPRHMHIPVERERTEETPVPKTRGRSSDTDEALMEIFERTYGKISPRSFETRKPPARHVSSEVKVIDIPKRPEYLLVDGYNVIHAWQELEKAASGDLDLSRRMLGDILDNYAATRDVHVILVFDAYKVRRGQGSSETYGNIEIVYTREAQTADSYIEKLAHELSSLNRVRVATSDGLEQLIILGGGALRMSAAELKNEIDASNTELRRILERLNLGRKGVSVEGALADAVRKRGQQ